MSNVIVTAPAAYAHLTRPELLDHILSLLTFDPDGSDCDTAMGLMRWNDIMGAELRTRRADRDRPFLRPVRGSAAARV